MARSLTTVALIIVLTTLAQCAKATESSVPFIHADAVHAQGITGRGVTVAVIDTGILYDEPGLMGDIAPGGTSFDHNGKQVHDNGVDPWQLGHGTIVSLVITDPTGVAPNAKILPIRITEGASGAATGRALISAVSAVLKLSQIGRFETVLFFG